MTSEAIRSVFREESDSTLVAATKNGESQAFEFLVKRHEAKTLSVAFRITRKPRGRSGRRAAELLQSVYAPRQLPREFVFLHLVDANCNQRRSYVPAEDSSPEGSLS